MKLISKALDVCTLALAGIAGVALGFLLLAVCYATFSRIFLNNPLSFMMEYATYTLIYIAFLSAPLILQQRKHIAVDVLVEALNPRLKRIVVVVTDVLGVLVCSAVCYFGTLVALGNFQRNVLVMDTRGTPQWLLVVAIPLGMLFMALQFLRHFYRDLQEIKKQREVSN